MKKNNLAIFVVYFLMNTLISACATAPNTNPNFTHETIIEVPGLSKEQIITKSKIWIVKNFRSAKSVIDYEDSVAGLLKGNAITQAPIILAGLHDLMYTFLVEAKDGRFKVTYSDFRWADGSHPSYLYDEKTKTYYMNSFDRINESLKTALTSTDDQNW